MTALPPVPAGWELPSMAAGLPDPIELTRSMTAVVEQRYSEAVQQRGAVHTPEDVFPIQRDLARVRDLFASYRTAFAVLTKLVGQLQEEQLVDAVGEVATTVPDGEGNPTVIGTGQPTAGLTIPDHEGDIQLTLDYENRYDIDVDSLVSVVIGDVLNDVHQVDDHDLPDLLDRAIRKMLELGKFEPQVTKVTAYAQGLARYAIDDLAAVVNSAKRKVRQFKGVAYKRKAPQ